MIQHRIPRGISMIAAAGLIALAGLATPVLAQAPAGGLPAAQALGAATPETEGGLVFEQIRFEFGSIEEGTRVPHRFAFTNTSDQAITITNVQASCGCTVPTLEKRTYQPGESGEIEAIFNSLNRVGNQMNSITVTTDNPAQPQVRLIMAGTVLRSARLEPSHVADFGVVRHGDGKTMTVHLIDTSGEAVEITELTSSNPAITLTQGETESVTDSLSGKPAIRIPIEVALDPSHPMEAIRGSITVRTNSSTHPAHALRLSGNVVGEISIAPAQAAFSAVQQGQTVVRSVNLTVVDNTAFELKGYRFDATDAPGGAINITDPKITVEQLGTTRGRANAMLNFTLEAGDESGRIFGNMLITGEIGPEDARREVTVPIPVSAFVRPAPRATSSAN